MWCATRLYSWSYSVLIHINYLANVCKHTFPLLYADDTNLLISGEDLTQVVHLINEELQEITFWLKVNKLSLNIKRLTSCYLLQTERLNRA